MSEHDDSSGYSEEDFFVTEQMLADVFDAGRELEFRNVRVERMNYYANIWRVKTTDGEQLDTLKLTGFRSARAVMKTLESWGEWVAEVEEGDHDE